MIRRLVSPALFGAVDGLTVVLGVMLPLLHRPSALILAGVGAAVAEAVGMAAGSWLSQDTDTGWAAAIVIGLATSVVSLIPLIPYMLLSGAIAVVLAFALIVAVSGAIAVARHYVQGRSWPRALGETYGILAIVAICVGACAYLAG